MRDKFALISLIQVTMLSCSRRGCINNEFIVYTLYRSNLPTCLDMPEQNKAIYTIAMEMHLDLFISRDFLN